MKSSASTSGRGWVTNAGLTPGAPGVGTVVVGGGADGSGAAVWSILGRFLAIMCFITSLNQTDSTVKREF